MPVVLKSRLPQIAASLPIRVRVGIESAAKQIASDAQARAPVGTPPDDPHPGRLQASIHAEEIDGQWWVVADARAGDDQSGAPYAHMVEFGTVDTAARPFLVPAAEENRVPTAVFVAGALRNL